MAIIDTIKEILVDHPKDYNPALAMLRDHRDNLFQNLTISNNIIVRNVGQATHDQLKFLIREYSAFSNESIHMLLDAMIRNHDWEKLKQEILRNIHEEMGSETKDIPHLEIMRKGYRDDLGIDTDSGSISFITRAFLYNMRKIFKHDDNAFSAGALLAFEGTAIQEFHIVDAVVKNFKKISEVSLTNYYIRGHKDFEIGHEKGLEEAIRKYIDSNNIGKMIQGYLSVCNNMDTWWYQIYSECIRKEISTLLKVKDIELYDPTRKLQLK